MFVDFLAVFVFHLHFVFSQTLYFLSLPISAKVIQLATSFGNLFATLRLLLSLCAPLCVCVHAYESEKSVRVAGEHERPQSALQLRHDDR